ncbi:MAG: hypothetical protein VX938_07510, partial [Myxococcota bacterium]|nr:hypothetical protein [Myxococcota bacterium]
MRLNSVVVYAALASFAWGCGADDSSEPTPDADASAEVADGDASSSPDLSQGPDVSLIPDV